MKKMFVFVEYADGGLMKVEIPQDFDGNMGNFISKLTLEYGEAKYYIGGLA